MGILATKVLLVKDPPESPVVIGDGVYGMFLFPDFWRNLTMDPPEGLEDTELRNATVFGPTCDGGDMIAKSMPVALDVQREDWLVFDYMGSYTSACGTVFNGIPLPSEV